MKKILSTVDRNNTTATVDSDSMKKFLSIVVEGKDTKTNRLSMAEQMAVQQYTPETRKDITSPVLNVSKDAKPNMIGKYFKEVEEEIAESKDRFKQRAKQIAERVTSKMHSASKRRIEEYYNVPATDSKSPIPGHVSGCQCKEVEEGLKDPKDNPCWKGYKPVGTKKKGGRTVPNCVPKEGVAEGIFGIDDKIKGKIQNITSKLSDVPGNWDHKEQMFTPQGMEELTTALKNNPKYIKYALNLKADDYEAEGVAEGGPKGYDSEGNPQGGGYDEYENNWLVTIDGNPWKTFDNEKEAYRVAAAIERKHGKKTSVHRN